MAYHVVKVVLNRKAVSDQLLKGAATKQLMHSIAERVAKQSGINTNMDTYDGINRSNVHIWPATWEDFRANLESNALLKALY